MAEPLLPVGYGSSVSESANRLVISGDSQPAANPAVGRADEAGSTQSRVATVAATSLQFPAEGSSAETMRLQIQMMEMQIRLREAETEALRAKTEMELKLREKDTEIAKILGEKKTNIYEVQLRDIQLQEVGLEDKILGLQRDLVEATRDSAEKSLRAGGRTNTPEGQAAEVVRIRHGEIQRALQLWIQKRNELAQQRQEIYRKMGAS